MDFLDTAITSIGHNPRADGCSKCGQPWRPSVDDARVAIATAPDAYRQLLVSGDPYHVPEDLRWHAAAYTWHVADVCRIWAERMVGHLGEPDRRLAAFDPDELADARDYLGMTATAATWALRGSVDLLLETVDDDRAERVFDHPDWHAGSFGDALRWVAHEVVHHQQDVRRCTT